MKTTRLHPTAVSMACLLASFIWLVPYPVRGGDPVAEAFDAYLESSADGHAAFSFDRSDYHYAGTDDRSGLPIGVFDSGIGGLTVLEALLIADSFDNENLKPGPDGRPDFEHERFLYLGDQANMPYGNYSKEEKTDYLRELILKDATFLLGNRYRDSAGSEPRFDKPPVKAIVIACNTATAYGLDDLRAAVERWKIPVIVIGVVEAGARGLLQRQESDTEGQAIGVLATVGTCSSGVYPKTIQSTLGKAGRRITTITQQGSADLAAIIEGDPAVKTSLPEQIAADVRALVETHRDSRIGKSPEPIGTIVLGCTHFPLAATEIEAAFVELRRDPAFEPFLTETREYVDPAAWTARQLFQELARENLRASASTAMATKRDAFYLSMPNPSSTAAVLATDGGLDHDYKYGRHPGNFAVEDTVVIRMNRSTLPSSSSRLVREKLPETWSRLDAGEPEDLDATPLVTTDWVTLFDGKTLDGWQSTSDANWRVEDGAIVVDDGNQGFLVYDDLYENFELSIDFKSAKGTNSGIFLNTTRKPASLIKDCYELNIAPPDNPFPTGSLVARQKVEGAGESDQWRTFEVRVDHGHVTVALDGKQVLDYQADPPSTGNLLGLQKNSGWVAFRNIKVRKLP